MKPETLVNGECRVALENNLFAFIIKYPLHYKSNLLNHSFIQLTEREEQQIERIIAQN